MQYRIYIDTLFVNNFAMNFFLLFLVSKMMRCSATHLSILLGAGVGSLLFCVLVLLPIGGILKIGLAYGVIGLGMVKTSLRLKEKHSLFMAVLSFYGMTFLFGGILRFLFLRIAFLQRIGISSLSVIVLSGGIFFLVISFLKQKRKEEKNITCNVSFKIGEQEERVIGIIDTGNGLYEPLSRRPVSIVEEAVLKPYIENGLLRGFCVIPYHSIGKSHGILEGYEIEEMQIQTNGIKRKQAKVVVAISKEKLSAAGQYQMILHPQFMKD